MQRKDPYKILGVPYDADFDTIKKAYRQLARETHPDLNPDNKESEDKLKEINEAWETLSDPDKKNDFDNLLRGWRAPRTPEEMFRMFEQKGRPMSFGPFSFGMQRPPPPPPAPGTRRGQNIELVLEATPFDILLQETLNLKYTRRIPCPECGGKGADLVRCIDCGGYGIRTETVQANVNMTITQSVACGRCQSTGYVKENACDSCGGTGLTIEEVETNINLHGLPPDYNWSEQIATVFRGQGNHGPNRGPAGDLVVVLKPVFPNPNSLAEDDRELLREVKASVYNESD